MSARPEPRALFLRGVNVGGAHRLPMADFRALLTGLGYDGVATYIQSGNAVLRAPGADAGVVAAVRAAVAARFGFAPDMVLRGADALAALLDHPFPGADPARVHAFLLADPDAPFDADRAAALRAPTEDWVLRDGALLLHTPDGLGKSKLAERLPRLFGCAVTARNLNTIAAMLALLRAG